MASDIGGSPSDWYYDSTGTMNPPKTVSVLREAPTRTTAGTGHELSMFCTGCGKHRDLDDKFCRYCGTKLKEELR